jgi:hypothetical protein
VILAGILIPRHDAARLVLLDGRGEVIDARCLREGETVREGLIIEFPVHSVEVGAVAVPGLTGERGRPRTLISLVADMVPQGRVGHVFGPSWELGSNGEQESPGSPSATVLGSSRAGASPHNSPFLLDSLLSHF